MSSGLYTHTTRAVGTILTAAIYNADHQNHITNQNPSMSGALSDTLVEYRSTADPGGSGSEILAASLAGELQRLRYVVSRIVGKTYWYEAPSQSLQSLGDADITAIAALTGTGIAVRTAADTWALRSLAIGAGLTLSNPAGLAGNPTFAADIGKQSIWMPAGAWRPKITNGCAALATLETATNKNIADYLAFDPTTQQFAAARIKMPKSWDEGTITFIPVWSHPATATNFGVVWGLDAVARSDNESIDASYGTAQTSIDTGGTTDQEYHAPESGAITVGQTPTTSDIVEFRIHRDPSDGSDTMAVVARLHGVLILYNTDVLKDN